MTNTDPITIGRAMAERAWEEICKHKDLLVYRKNGFCGHKYILLRDRKTLADIGYVSLDQDHQDYWDVDRVKCDDARGLPIKDWVRAHEIANAELLSRLITAGIVQV